MTTETASSRLLTLPLEVLLTISSHLTTPEFGHLRLACKHIEASLFPSFSREFFSKRQFMLTEFSLQALVDISRSRLSPSVSHVIIGLDRPTPIALHSMPPVGNGRVKGNYLRQEYMDHLSLCHASHDVEMMSEAFGNLHNLDTVGLRDFNSRSRHRDGPSSEWRSYGSAKFARDAGFPLNLPTMNLGGMWGRTGADDQWPVYQSRVFLCILRALEKSGARPHSLQVILRRIGLDDHAFNLPKFVRVQPVLATLRTLFLDLHDGHAPISTTGDDGQARVDCPSYLLRGFLSNIPELRHLRLNFRFYAPPKAEDFLSWLARPAGSIVSAPRSNKCTLDTWFAEVPLPVEFSHLNELNIGMVTLKSAVLLGLARKFRSSLHRLELHKVSLREPDSGPDSDKKINHWAKLLGQLSKLNTNLTALVLSLVSQERQVHGRPPRKILIQFKGSSASSGSVRWAGRDIEGGLKDIANSMLVSWPDDDLSGDSSMEDEDSLVEHDESDTDSESMEDNDD